MMTATLSPFIKASFLILLKPLNTKLSSILTLRLSERVVASLLHFLKLHSASLPQAQILSIILTLN